MNTEYRCDTCNKKLFEGNIALLVQKKRQDLGQERPFIEVLCRGCKKLNRFEYDPSNTVTK